MQNWPVEVIWFWDKCGNIFSFYFNLCNKVNMFTFDPRSAAKRVWRFFAFQGESGPAGPSGAPGTRGAPVSGPQHKNSEKKWKVLSRFGKMISLRKITKLFLWTRVRVVFTSEDSFHIKPNDQKEKKQIDRVWWKPVPKRRPFSQVSIQALFKNNYVCFDYKIGHFLK